MKKIIALLLVVSSLFIAGCGENSEKPEEVTPKSETAQKLKEKIQGKYKKDEPEKEKKKENKKLIEDEDAFIKYIKEQLGVPDSKEITYKIGNPYNWEAVEGQPELVSVVFEINGELVAGADCSTETGEITRSIINYIGPAEPTKEAQEGYFTYRNEQYGFTIDIPNMLTEKKAFDNGGSVRFHTKDESVNLFCNGSFWPESQLDSVNIDNYYKYTLDSLGYNATYRALSDNWFVISGEYDGIVEYSKYYLKSDGSESVFTITYPKSREKEFDPIVTHIVRSFKLGKGTVSTVEK